ncbi:MULTISPECIES: hypothetical protein [unclassified Adlercreutzia]|uniref:hypothetical protein n=1 Tax=unclassified Adlercreutzia TaxID=2636013 RepID=UPI0013ED8AFC|nr:MULTISPECIES: hypothetical protein [unclassified Adlercreutzia]
MGYVDLIKAGADDTDMKKYLSEGDQVAITIRIPRNLRDASKEAAALRGISFSALIRQGMIQQLVEKE